MENCQSLTNGLMPSRWTSTDSAQSLFFDCHDLSTIVIYRKEQISSRTMQRNLKERKGANHQYYATLMIFKLCSFIRWENWKLTVTIGVVVVVLVIVIIVLAVVFAPSSPVWHVETANISFFCLLYDPGICFTMAYVVLLEFTIKISECHVALLEELMGILHKETQTRKKSPKICKRNDSKKFSPP